MKKFDTIILNYANCDMVGHTTDFNASVKAVETVDQCLGRVYEAVKKVDGTLIVVADHGNAEQLVDEDGSPFSAHTTNPVPFIITRKDVLLRERGNLGDITPTMLELLGVPQPKAMTGKSMIKGYLNNMKKQKLSFRNYLPPIIGLMASVLIALTILF